MGRCYKCFRETNELALGICSACSLADSMKEQSKRIERKNTPSTPIEYNFHPNLYYGLSFIFVILHYFGDHFNEFNIGRIWSSLIMLVVYFFYVKLLVNTYHNNPSSYLLINFLFRILHILLLCIFWLWSIFIAIITLS